MTYTTFKALVWGKLLGLWRFRFGLGLIVLVIVIIYGYRVMQSPAIGSVAGQNTIVHDAPPKTPELVQFQGQYISFDYPSDYKSTESATIKPPFMEMFSFLSYQPGKESNRISLMIKSSADGTVATADSAYVFRKNQVDQYISGVETINNQLVHKMIKKDGSEVTYFVQGATAYTIIAGTTTKPSGRMSQDVRLVVESLRWVK